MKQLIDHIPISSAVPHSFARSLFLMSLSSALRDISSQSNESRISSLKTLIHRSILTDHSASAVEEIAQYLLQTLGMEQYGRTYIVPEALDFLLATLSDPDSDGLEFDSQLPLLKKLGEMLRSKVEDFPEAFCRSIELLAEFLQEDGDLRGAAVALNSVKFDEIRSKTCYVQPVKRFQWHVKTAELWLAADEIGPASQQIKRAHAFLNEIKDPAVILKFKTLFARILDHERKFLEAALRYLELAQNQYGLIAEADVLKTLQYAVSCAILAKAGPPRSRVLAILYSDERSKSLSNFFMLEKMYGEQLIKPDEVAMFETMLETHQKAINSSGHSVVQSAVIEHNVLAAAKIYANIKIESLGALLGISTTEAETLASQMIEQGRLNATIDQVESAIEFSSGGAGTEGANIIEWDSQIASLCLAVNRVVEKIGAKHPQLIQ
jgi:COP9 signalosome complex subunit 4